MRGSRGIPAPFLDMAMGVIFVFLAVIMISTVEEPKKATTEAPIPKAEFLVTLEWDDGSQDDIDLYLRDPSGAVTYFSNRQTALAFLDADNLGVSGNSVSMPDGSSVSVFTRREVITIRAIVPGEYVANAHFYKRHGADKPNHLKLTIVKINPFSEITRATAVFDTQGQEQTLANFTVAPDGSVSSVFLAPVQLVGK